MHSVWSHNRSLGKRVDLLITIALQVVTFNWKSKDNISINSWWNLACHNHRLDRYNLNSVHLALKREKLWLPIPKYISQNALINVTRFSITL